MPPGGSTRRFAFAASLIERLAIGLVALGALVVVEFSFVLSLRDLTLAQYVAGRDSVSGLGYIALLGAFVALPALMPRSGDAVVS